MTSIRDIRDFETDIKSFDKLEELVKSLGLSLSVTEKSFTEDLAKGTSHHSYYGDISLGDLSLSFHYADGGAYTVNGEIITFYVADHGSSMKGYVDNEITERLSKVMTISKKPALTSNVSDFKDNLILFSVATFFLAFIGFAIYGVYAFFKY